MSWRSEEGHSVAISCSDAAMDNYSFFNNIPFYRPTSWRNTAKLTGISTYISCYDNCLSLIVLTSIHPENQRDETENCSKPNSTIKLQSSLNRESENNILLRYYGWWTRILDHHIQYHHWFILYDWKFIQNKVCTVLETTRNSAESWRTMLQRYYKNNYSEVVLFVIFQVCDALFLVEVVGGMRVIVFEGRSCWLHGQWTY